MNTNSERSRDRPDIFTRWVLGIVASLIALGVAALWNLNGSFNRLDERVAVWTITFSHMSGKLDDIGRRVGSIESEQAARGPRLDRLEREVSDVRRPK